MGYYLRCPTTAMELYSAAKEGSVRGYFMLAFAPAQARIADMWIDSESSQDWRSLVDLAVRQAAQKPNVEEVVSMANDPLTSCALLECGFHLRGSYPLRVLACGNNKLPDMPICFRMLDSDLAYLHNDQRELWA
jgi:hypothetical protein